MSEFSYKSNPKLKTIKPNYPGNRFKNGMYFNDVPRYQPTLKDILQWQIFNKKPQKEEKKRDKFKVKLIENRAIFTEKQDTIMWLGHASFFIRINGTSILTDPCYSPLGFLKRRVGLPCNINDIKGLDYLLLSHNHRDHFDKPSLRKILKNNPSVEWLAPLGMGKMIRPFRVTNYQEAGWYQQFSMNNGLEITCLPAIHWNRRYLHDLNRMLWGSFLIRWKDGQGKQKTIFFAGDSAYGEHFKEIKALVGEIDIVFMPIGAYKPRIIMKSSHVNPEEATQAFNELGAKIFIPMHYGTYDLSDEPAGEPIRMMRQFAKDGTLKGALKELAVGETFDFN